MKAREFWEGVGISALFGLTTVPLMIAPLKMFPFVVGKAYFVRAIAVLALMGWGASGLRGTKSDRVAIFFGLFVFTMAIADLLGQAPAMNRLFGSWPRRFGLFDYIALFGIFQTTAILSLSLWRKWFAASVCVSGIVSSYAIAQHEGLLYAPWGSRVDGAFGNPSLLATYLVVQIFFAIFLYGEAARGAKIFLMAAALLDGTVVMLTETRGAALGLVAGLVILGIRYREAAVYSAIAVLSAALSTGLAWRLTQMGDDETTLRWQLWKIAVNDIREAPWFGRGEGGFLAFSNMYGLFDKPHNIILEWFITGGVFTGAAALALWASSAMVMWARDETALCAGLVAYLVCGFFFFDGIVSAMMAVMLYGYASKTIGEKACGTRCHVFSLQPRGLPFCGARISNGMNGDCQRSIVSITASENTGG